MKETHASPPDTRERREELAEAAEREPVRYQTVSTVGEFEALRQEWSQVLATTAPAHLCLTHDWLAAWWNAFDRRQERVAVVLAQEGGRLVAAAPLQRRATSVAGVPVRTLEFAANLHTFRFDFVVPGEGDPRSLIDGLLGHALEAGSRPDVLFFKDLPRDSPTVPALEEFASRRRLVLARENERRSPYVCTDGSWEDYFKSLSKSLRSSLRRFRKRCLEAGASFERVADANSGASLLEEGLSLEAGGWKGREQTAILASPEETSFYRGLLGRFGGSGGLEQYSLRLGDRLICWDVCITHAGACHDLKTAYAEDQAPLSPGFALQMAMMEHLFQAPEVCVYDMLPPAAAYKRRWSPHGFDQVSLRLYAPTPRGRLAWLLQGRMRPLLRRSSLLRRAKRRLIGDG